MTAIQRPVIFGEVLFDCFPDGNRVLGGAPFNVAWHNQGFGMSPLFVSCVGIDDNGRDIIDSMAKWGMDCSAMKQDVLHPTGLVDIRFKSNEPEYTIVENSAWDFIEIEQLELPVDSILYHGSLALRSAQSRQTLEQIKSNHMGKIFVDINLRDPWWSPELIKDLLESCDYLKLNSDELFSVVKSGENKQDKVDWLLSTYNFDLIILTDGEQGATAYQNDGITHYVKPEKSNKVVDTVGAGDAFSSVILLGLCNDWDLAISMKRAQQFASRIVEVQGAVVKEAEFYQHLLDEWGSE